MVKILKMLKKFREDRTAVAYLWVVAGVTIMFVPVIYFILHTALTDTVAALFAQTTLTGYPLLAWNLVSALISALPAFLVITSLIWVAVNSKARSND
jgi:hypothetical protein